MPIDPRIALGVQPVQMPDFMGYANQAANILQSRASEQNALALMAQRQRQEQQALKLTNALRGLDPTNPEAVNQLYQLPGGAAEVENIFKAKRAQTEAGTAAMTASSARNESSLKRIASFNNWLQAWANIAEEEEKGLDPAKAGAVRQALRQAYNADPTPQGFENWKRQTMFGLLPLEQQLSSTRTTTDYGGGIRVDVQPTYLQQIKQEDIRKTLPPVQPSFAATSPDYEGNVIIYDQRTGQPVNQLSTAPKPSGEQEARITARSTDEKNIAAADKIIAELLKPESIVYKAGGGGPTAVKNAAARLIGQSTPEMEAQAALNVAADILLKQVPRFEGPQSDKDTISYNQAAGNLRDPMVLPAEKIAAIKQIQEINQRRLQYMRDNPLTGPGTQYGTGAAGGTPATSARIPLAGQTPGNQVNVTVNGKTYTFPSQREADAFKKAAGITK